MTGIGAQEFREQQAAAMSECALQDRALGIAHTAGKDCPVYRLVGA